MTLGPRGDKRTSEVMGDALELTEHALALVSQIAIEEIRDGTEPNSHVDAAERDMRSALRQLGLAERELRTKGERGMRGAERASTVAEVVPGPGSSAPRGA